MWETSVARRLMTSVVAAAPDRSRVLHWACFLTAAGSLYPHHPPPKHPPLPGHRRLMHSTSPQGPRGQTHMCVYACVFVWSLRHSALTVSRTSKWFGEMAMRCCSSSPCLYIHFTSPSVNTQAHMHIQNKQANKQYPSFDTAQRASAGCSLNNNDSLWHSRMTVKYNMSPMANYKNKNINTSSRQSISSHGEQTAYVRAVYIIKQVMSNIALLFFFSSLCGMT